MIEPDLSCIDDLHTIAQMEGCSKFLGVKKRFKWSKRDSKSSLREIYSDSTYRLDKLVTNVNNETREAYTERTGQKAQTQQEYAQEQARQSQYQWTQSQENMSKAYWDFVNRHLNRGRY